MKTIDIQTATINVASIDGITVNDTTVTITWGSGRHQSDITMAKYDGFGCASRDPADVAEAREKAQKKFEELRRILGYSREQSGDPSLNQRYFLITVVFILVSLLLQFWT
jgi:hypothetical protein